MKLSDRLLPGTPLLAIIVGLVASFAAAYALWHLAEKPAQRASRLIAYGSKTRMAYVTAS
ncbi:MAG: hypothetical protein E5Y56_03230 [Mesorhizobium sp.]|nr:MAG: hypothetical protein E5Y56_03230 [Mesorhizobium sp.]